MFAAVAQAQGARTLGYGAGGSEVHCNRWCVTPRGALVGQGLYWAAGTLFSDLGAHIIAVFLLLAGVLLLTGATVAGVVRATSTHVVETTRAMRPKPRPPVVRPPEPAHVEPTVKRVEDLQAPFAA